MAIPQELIALGRRAEQLPPSLETAKYSVEKAIQIATVDREMALVRARKTLEGVLRVIWKSAFPSEEVGTRMLDTLLIRLKKEGHIPDKVFALGTSVKTFGDFAGHGDLVGRPGSEGIELKLVLQTLEYLIEILEWFSRQKALPSAPKLGQPRPTQDVILLADTNDTRLAQKIVEELRRDHIEASLIALRLSPLDAPPDVTMAELERSDACVLCIGPGEWSPWQHELLCEAILTQIRQRGMGLIPVLLSGGERPDRGRMPDFLRGGSWVDMRGSGDELAGYDDLRRRILGLNRMRTPGSLPPGTCPYRGLRHFDVVHAPYFYGRESRIEWLLDAIRPRAVFARENRLIAIVGASGSGKSSLARAGLIAALKRGAIPGSEQWPMIDLQPGSDPLEGLAIALNAEDAIRPWGGDVGDLIHRFEEDKKRLHLLAKCALHGKDEGARLVVLVDQFEEVFTLCKDEAQQKAFLDNVCHAAMQPGGRTIVVLTMRADFFGFCAGHEHLADALALHTELIPPLNDEELQQAIERPAQIAGSEVQRELTEALIRDMRNQPGALPLLQHALRLLWDQKGDGPLTLEAYTQVGRIEGALERHANEVYDALSPEEKSFCRYLMIRLTKIADGTADTRRRIPLADLPTTRHSAAVVNPVVQKLTDARLLTTSRTDHTYHHEATVEVAHEALIQSWSKLRNWLGEDRESHRLHQELAEEARRWEGHKAQIGYEVHGERLRQYLLWADTKWEELNPSEQSFLEASLTRVINDFSSQELEQFPFAFEELEKLGSRTALVLQSMLQVAEQSGRRKLFVSLALVPKDPTQVPFLLERLLTGDSTVLPLVLDRIRCHKSSIHSSLWEELLNEGASNSRRLRAALALSFLDGQNEDPEYVARWRGLGRSLAGMVVASVAQDPDLYEVLSKSLRPVRRHLLSHLADLCLEHRGSLERSWAAKFLSDLADDQPQTLAALLWRADSGLFPVIVESLRPHAPQAIEWAARELRSPSPSEEGETAREDRAHRQANAAIALIQLGRGEHAWPLLEASPDPRARSNLIHRLAELGIDPNLLARELPVSTVGRRRALLLALGEYVEKIPRDLMRNLAEEAKKLFLHDEDPGIHAAAEWLLRTWGYQKELAELEADLSTRVTLEPDPRASWFPTAEGHTLVVIQGTPFLMGSTVTDPDIQSNEKQHRRVLIRRFAIATKSVTKLQFEHFRRQTGVAEILDSEYILAINRSDGFPMTYVTWYEAAAYCNWLSARHGYPQDQWCYVPNDSGEYALGMRMKSNFLSLSGFRLPTEAEWEFACRSGTSTRRYFGHSDALLEKYAWYTKNSNQSLAPVGALKPNDFGLFDMHGGIWNWCNDRGRPYQQDQDDSEDLAPLSDKEVRVLRGGAYVNLPAQVRSACRNVLNYPNVRLLALGFRVAKTQSLAQATSHVS